MVKTIKDLLEHLNKAIGISEIILDSGIFTFLHTENEDPDAIGAELERLKVDPRDIFAYEFIICTLYSTNNLEYLSTIEIKELFSKYKIYNLYYEYDQIKWQSNFSKII